MSRHKMVLCRATACNNRDKDTCRACARMPCLTKHIYIFFNTFMSRKGLFVAPCARHTCAESKFKFFPPFPTFSLYKLHSSYISSSPTLFFPTLSPHFLFSSFTTPLFSYSSLSFFIFLF